MAKSYIFDANKTTPAEVARRRKIAEALAGPYRPQNVGEGLSAIGAAFGSRIAANRASKAEQAGYAHAGEVMSPIFEGFFGGGSSAAPATADAGGVPSPEPIKTDWNGDPGEFIQYANQGAIRNQPLSEDLVNSLGFMQDMGLTMKVFSGGQDATGSRRTGSHRHDGGKAADVFLYKDGRQLDWANPDDLPIIQEFVSRGKAAGLTGFGAGEGYMQPGSLHIGFGSPAVWGARGKGANAPDWLRTAYSTPYQPQEAQGQPQPVQVASASPTSLRDGVRMAYARLDNGIPVPSPAGGAAAPVSAPPPQAPGPQVAQAQPQGGQPQPKLGQSMVGLPTLLKAAQDPWVAQNPLYSGIINQLIGIELKARMPMSEAEKMDLDMKRLQLEKTALELNQMRNPKPETTTINGNLVNSQTGEVIGSYPDPTKAPTVQKLKLSDGSEVAVQWDGEKQGWVPINAPEGGGLANPKNKLTESQSKLTLFQSLQTETQPILLDLEKRFNPGNLPDAFARGVLGGNFLQTREGQIYNSAATAWAEGALRIATGAAATPEEMERTKKAYFAQPGDSPETIAFKAQMREMYNRSIQRGLGEKDVQGKLELPMDFAAKVQQDGGQGGVPEGVDPGLWEVMTPEEKALWQN